MDQYLELRRPLPDTTLKPKKTNQTAPSLGQQTRANLEFPTILDFFATKTHTGEGKSLLLSLDLMDPETQLAHYTLLEAVSDYLADHALPRIPAIPAPGFFNRQPILDPFEKEEIREIRDVLLFCRLILADDNLVFAHQGLQSDPGLDQLTHALQDLFDPSGEWQEHVSPGYAQLIRHWIQTGEQLDRLFSEQLKRYGAYLNEAIVYERNHRKVLAVKQNFKGRVKGIHQDYSASGHTVYVEPEQTVVHQNRLTRIQSEIEKELWRIRCEVTEQILGHPVISERICPALARLDMMQALALTARATQAIPIRPNHDGRLELYTARHPFLDQAFAPFRQQVFEEEKPDRNHMVPFSLSLNQETRGLVISGANTGGKTVTLKTSGLLAWMANSGLPVPVDEGSHIPWYGTIVADIGDHQSLSHNLSTYASHLANMKRILSQEDPHTLVLLDELGSGTDPQEGNALAQSLIEKIMDHRFHLLITTHQQILCTLALNHPLLDNGSMIFDSKRLKPTYRFSQGVPGRSHALETAANSGLPDDLLDRARQLIDEDQVDIQAAIRQLQNRHQQLRKQQQKLRRDELRLHRRIQDTKREADKLKKDREELKEKARVRLARTVEKAEKELRALLRDFESTRGRRTMVNKFAEVSKALLEPCEQPRKLDDIPMETSGEPVESWQTGDAVFLTSWLKEARLLGIDRKKARVDCGGKVITLHVSELLHLKQESKPPEPSRVTEFLENEPDDTLSMELKLLGFHVEDALLELDRKIDLILRRGVPFLKVIHGHGSGALKQAVRDFLRTHQARDSFQVKTDLKNDGVTELHFH